MKRSQYSNVVKWTLRNIQDNGSKDSLHIARSILSNCGVSLPSGSLKEILLTLTAGDYMWWKNCTCEKAQEIADTGVPVIGIDSKHIVVILPNEAEKSTILVESPESTFVMSATEIPLEDRTSMQFFASVDGSTTTTTIPTPSSLIIEGKPTNNTMYVDESFTLRACMSNDTFASVNPTWTYDSTMFHTWDELIQHQTYKHFFALKSGITNITATFGNLSHVFTITIKPYILVNNWLRLYKSPTISSGGRTVNIPTVASFTGSDGHTYQFTNKNYWYAYENPYGNNINPYARNQIISLGKTVTINVGSCGELTDENGRYWMAVGPNVANPNHASNQAITASEMYGKGVLDVVIKDSAGTKYYIPAVVGDAKGHTWSNGVIQTWKSFPSGNFTSANANFNGTVAAEFIGSLGGDLSGLGSYSIDSIIFYED